mgnify:CR=1 FL=1
MKFSLITGIFLIGSLFLAAATMADRETSENGLIGTWTDVNYSFTLVQDGSAVMLTGIPFDEESDFPLILTGMLSDNNTRLVTNKNMTGTMEIRMSEDLMELSGIQTFDPVIPSESSFTMSYNSTRNGTGVQPDAVWSGEWIVENMSMTLFQTGEDISGFFHVIQEPDTKVYLNGFVSDDVRNVSLNWTFAEFVNFTLSDDGMHLIDEACRDGEIKEGYLCLNLQKQVGA